MLEIVNKYSIYVYALVTMGLAFINSFRFVLLEDKNIKDKNNHLLVALSFFLFPILGNAFIPSFGYLILVACEIAVFLWMSFSRSYKNYLEREELYDYLYDAGIGKKEAKRELQNKTREEQIAWLRTVSFTYTETLEPEESVDEEGKPMKIERTAVKTGYLIETDDDIEFWNPLLKEKTIFNKQNKEV